jgi:cobalt/nickel transport protein
VSLTKKLGVAIVVLALASPIGLLLPEFAGAGSAWGEWGADEIGEIAGYVPEGLAKLAGLWRAILSDYSFPGREEGGLGRASLAYVASAIVGVALCAGLAFLLGKLLAKRDKR